MATIRISDLSRLFVSLAGALMLSTLCLGAALAPAQVASVATVA